MTHHNHENQKWHPAEELNGRLAMIGIVAALLNYAWTGQIIPGIWYCQKVKAARAPAKKRSHVLHHLATRSQGQTSQH